ncbi:hypothetical protein [Neosynechococcus sphagnicola]|uniref:ABC transporter permease n=1 Tax=Neosynechococcus sphagnicola TaxID=1501145 RepID=UPI000AAAF427
MVGANIFQFVVGVLPLLAVVALIKSGSILNVLALSLPLLALIFVSMGVSFFVSALYVFFRDLPYFYELILLVILMSSAVFYPANIVQGNVKKLLGLNPLASIIESLRQIAVVGTAPDLILIGKALLSSLLILGLGWLCFSRSRSQFMDLL